MKEPTKIHAKASSPSRPLTPQNLLNQAMLDTLPIGVMLLNSRLCILSVNAEAVRLLGHSADLCSSKPLQEILLPQPEASAHNITTRIQESLLDRRSIPATYTMLKGLTHASHPVEWSYVPLDTGEDSGGVLTIRDLTRERELQQDYDRLARVAEESPSPIIELDSDTNLVYANSAMTLLLQQFGYDANGFPAVCPGELSQIVRRCFESGQEIRGEAVCLPQASFSWIFCQ